MTFIDGAAVSLAEVAKHLRVPISEVEAEARQLNLFVGVDWAGRPALAAVDAQRLVSGAARRDAEHAKAQSAFTVGQADWQRRREQVRLSAFQAAFDAARSRNVPGPQAAEKGHEGARAALAEFDRANPEPRFRVSSEERPRLFGRRKERV